MFGDMLQGALGGVDQCRGVVAVAEVLGDERLMRGGGRDPQFLDVGELDGLRLERFVLARLRVDGVDLGQGSFQGFGLAEAFPRGAAELIEFGLAGLPVGVELLVGPERPGEALPANLSRAPRCATGLLSRICSDWPWTTTRVSPISPSTPTGAARPPR